MDTSEGDVEDDNSESNEDIINSSVEIHRSARRRHHMDTAFIFLNNHPFSPLSGKKKKREFRVDYITFQDYCKDLGSDYDGDTFDDYLDYLSDQERNSSDDNDNENENDSSEDDDTDDEDDEDETDEESENEKNDNTDEKMVDDKNLPINDVSNDGKNVVINDDNKNVDINDDGNDDISIGKKTDDSKLIEEKMENEKCKAKPEECPICFRPFSPNGHATCSLRCGHVFGYPCVVKLKDSSRYGTQFKCPNCRDRSSMSDVRMIYFGTPQMEVTANATSEKIKKLKNENKELSFAYHSLRKQKNNIERLHEKELNKKKMIKFSLDKNICKNFVQYKTTIDLSKEDCGEAKFIEYDKYNLELVIAQEIFPPNGIPFDQTWGVKCIDLLTMEPTSIISLHSKKMIDMQICPLEPDQILTIGRDSIFQIFSSQERNGKICVMNHGLKSKFTSCCWSSVNDNRFLIGDKNGSIHLFDKKFPRRPISSLNVCDGPVMRMINSKVKNDHSFLATSLTNDIFSIDSNMIESENLIEKKEIEQGEEEYHRNRYDINSTTFLEDNIFLAYRPTTSRQLNDHIQFELMESDLHGNHFNYSLNEKRIISSTVPINSTGRSKSTLVRESRTSLGIHAHGDDGNFHISTFNSDCIDYSWKFPTHGLVRDIGIMHSDENILESIIPITKSHLYVYDFHDLKQWEHLDSTHIPKTEDEIL